MAFDEPDVRVLFPVPLLTIRLHGFERLNPRLMKEIAARRKAEPGIDRSNRYGWHSANDLFDRTEPAHRELAAELKAMTAASSAKLMPDLAPDLVPSHEGWVNVNPTGAMNAPHDHPGTFWSGVYYVHVPVPAEPEDKSSGAIEFIDPRGSIGTNARIETPFTRGKFTVRPAPGTCLLWPSYLKHWVHPNQATDDRVTVAFNSWFNRVAPRSDS
ncbi:MAG TPA: TIGR02466 family protein [Sphingomicrobium sp.]|nr:TIGR02466 family protein [Sphingomicrobium sp.]